MIKIIRSLEKLNEISPKTVKALEDELTEREEMAGILEYPVEQQRIMKRLANNRFAALSEEEDEEHGGRLTMTDICARPIRHVAINYDGILAKGTRMKNDDYVSIGTTHSTETVRRSNVIPGRAMTRGEAWNVIRERNWVQQTIADRDNK